MWPGLRLHTATSMPVPPGGLKVHPRLRTIELRRAFLIGVSGLSLVGCLAAFALWRTWGAVDAAVRYPIGVPATHAHVTKWSIIRLPRRACETKASREVIEIATVHT
jgi:hypothetical protein